MKNIVVIGGGTGSFVALSGLKTYVDKLHLDAIVTVADSGGSAKQERDEFGLLPVSDVRKALLALSRDTDERHQRMLRELFKYRFVNGQAGLRGGTFGNLFLVALSNVLGSEQEAIEEVEKMLQTEGSVIPVSLKTSNLVMEYENGQVIVGEHYLDNFPGDGTVAVNKLSLLPPLEANPKAIESIETADIIILPPGDLFASVLVNFQVAGIKEALLKKSPKVFYAVNLMTKYGQTYDLTARGHVDWVEKAIGMKLDKILINNAPLPQEAIGLYEAEKDYPVVDDLEDDERIIRCDLLSQEIVKNEKGDSIKRSLIRHDPEKFGRAIISILD
ncbi:YvcK family protein [candidate division WWE3 bacterium]|uniref:YvcK family protein n=1 Tax=candidate division WWE3 bacterium TaxID=2053526 RepID=A0A955RR30_UNCKA|nr:YvcK family protein [candidate division WWE3 bacterium]